MAEIQPFTQEEYDLASQVTDDEVLGAYADLAASSLHPETELAWLVNEMTTRLRNKNKLPGQIPATLAAMPITERLVRLADLMLFVATDKPIMRLCLASWAIDAMQRRAA